MSTFQNNQALAHRSRSESRENSRGNEAEQHDIYIISFTARRGEISWISFETKNWDKTYLKVTFVPSMMLHWYLESTLSGSHDLARWSNDTYQSIPNENLALKTGHFIWRRDLSFDSWSGLMPRLMTQINSIFEFNKFPCFCHRWMLLDAASSMRK